MPATITDVDTLKLYISGVMDRADHHAGNVDAIGLALAGAIVWRKDPDPIEVMSRGGELTNVLWVKISGRRYAFSYNHQTQEIEMRQDSTHGAVMHRFSNNTPIVQVQTIFQNL